MNITIELFHGSQDMVVISDYDQPWAMSHIDLFWQDKVLVNRLINGEQITFELIEVSK